MELVIPQPTLPIQHNDSKYRNHEAIFTDNRRLLGERYRVLQM